MAEIVSSDEVQKMIRAGSDAVLKFKQFGVRNVVKNSFSAFSEGENLERLGRDRNLPRYQGEDVNEYRLRVEDAYPKNLGLGNVEDIKRVMEGLGKTTLGVQYRFNSHIQGDNGDSSTGLFNILTKSTAGGTLYDGSKDYDFDTTNLLFDSPDANDIVLEIVQPGAISASQISEIQTELAPIIRASQVIFKIVKIAP